MKDSIILVKLSDEQIVKAKEANGSRKQITHGLVVTNYGAMFGTEKQCRKYYEGWSENFKDLIGSSKEVDAYSFDEYISANNISTLLAEESNKRLRKATNKAINDLLKDDKPKKKGFLARFFSKP